MADEITCRADGRVGRITLTRPEALNALTHGMCLAISDALSAWQDDPRIHLVMIEGEGERAFCAGGDLASLYAAGRAGDFATAARFWADEYRMNAQLFRFPKPVVTFLHGYTLGGGVGLGCHGSHRIVGETSRIALPEVGVGLVPDVGGSLLLARAPGRLGEYLGLTARRMGPGDAILAEFADYFIPEALWPALKEALVETGDWEAIDRAAASPPEDALGTLRSQLDAHFAGETLGDILTSLSAAETDFARSSLEAIGGNAPLACAATVELIHRVRARDDIGFALAQEYRFTSRALEHGDFLEGIRAAVIDKDRKPNWQFAGQDVPQVRVAQMLMPLGDGELKL